jgi:hypothetical protein
MKWPRLFLTACVLCLMQAAHAASQAQTQTQTQETEPPVILSKSMDAGHDEIEERVNLFVDWVDEFFGGDRVFEETRDNYVKVSIGKIIEEGGNVNNANKLSAQINLPRTEDRLKLLITSEPETDEIAGNLQPRETLSGVDTSNEQSTALRFVARETDVWNIHTDLGVRYQSGVDPFGRFRVRRTVALTPWTLHFAETFFWYDSLGRGETTHVDFERPVNSLFLFRATSEATWRDQTDYFDLVQDLMFLHRVSDRRSVIYQASAFAVTEPVEYVTDYLLGIRLRQLIHRDWLFFEINPQINYPKELHFKAVPTLTLKLDVIF